MTKIIKKSGGAKKISKVFNMRDAKGKVLKKGLTSKENKVLSAFVKLRKKAKNNTSKLKTIKSNEEKYKNKIGKKYGDKLIGVNFSKSNKIYIYDLLDKTDRQRYIDNTKNRKHNISITDVKRVDSNLTKKLKAFRFKQAIKPIKAQEINVDTLSKGIVKKYSFATDMKFTGNLDDLLSDVSDAIRMARGNTVFRHRDVKYSVSLSANPDNPFDRRVISSRKKKWDLGELIDLITSKIRNIFEEYEDDLDKRLDFKYITINYLIEPFGKILGKGGHKTFQNANKYWFVCDTTARSNCFFRSIAVDRIMEKLNTNIDDARNMLIDDEKLFLEKINEKSKNMKKVLKLDTRKNYYAGVNEDTIQKWVDSLYYEKSRLKCEVVIYNNIFAKTKIFRPKNYKAGDTLRKYEIQIIDNHYVPLVRWWKVCNIIEICKERQYIQNKKVLDAVGQSDIIKKFKKYEITDPKAFDKWLMEVNYTSPKEYKKLSKNEQRRLHNWFCKIDKEHKYSSEFKEPKNNRIATYDLEATTNGCEGNKFKSFCVSWAENNLDEYENVIGKSVRNVGGEDSIKSWFEALYSNRNQYFGYTFYAHNGGKFDFMLLMNEYLLKDKSKWEILQDKFIVLNGCYLNVAIASVEAEGVDRCVIQFRDSMKLLAGSQAKLCEEFDVEHKKIGEVVNHDEVNIGNCFGGKVEGASPKSLFSSERFKVELTQKVYCNYDTLGLLEIMNSFSDDVYEDTGINITDCFTGATLSKKHYFTNYYDTWKDKIYTLSLEMDAFCRQSYYGGRNEAHYIGEWCKKCYYYDFTSLYPDVGRRLLPTGKPVRYEKDDIDLWNDNLNEGRFHNNFNGYAEPHFQYQPRSAIVKVKVKTKNFDAIPLHSIYHNNRTMFPHFKKPTELTMWYRELMYGVSLGIYEYELIDGIYFETRKEGEKSLAGKKSENDDAEKIWGKGFMEQFFNDAFKNKAVAKKLGKSALSKAYKIIANSGYGFWGLNVMGSDGDGRDGMIILSEDDDYLWELYGKEEITAVGKVGEYVMVRTAKELEIAERNVAIASAICSEARMKLYSLLKTIKDKGCNILYMDTDSVITDMKLDEYPDVVKKFDWDDEKDEQSYGEVLGGLKNEAIEKLEGYCEKKCLKEGMDKKKDKSKIKQYTKEFIEKQIEIDNGEIHFDRGIIAGCKNYCLHKKLWDGGYVEASASKGCSRKLTYGDYEHLFYGTKKNEQMKIEKELLVEKLLKNPKDKWEMPYLKGEWRLYDKLEIWKSSICEHIEEGSYTDIAKIKVNKSFRQQYTKGKVRKNGEVVPLII